jgi:D-alanine-D-alanine ligase
MKKVALLCGGYSQESVISMRSAITIENNLMNCEIFKIEIHENSWFHSYKGRKVNVNKNRFTLLLEGDLIEFDYVFIMIHGTPGEDGKLAAYFDMLGIPYSSSNHLASSLTANKSFCNKYLKNFDVKVADSLVLYKSKNWKTELMKINYPCFVKPNTGGSSLGTFKVENEQNITNAIQSAFEHDEEVIVEDFVEGREFTCGVVEYKDEIISLEVTEIIPQGEFFDFEQKYKENGAKEITPAKISTELSTKIKSIAEYVFQVLNLKNMARIDFIGDLENLYLIEVNTIPGFSEASILPQQLREKEIDISDFLTAMVNR